MVGPWGSNVELVCNFVSDLNCRHVFAYLTPELIGVFVTADDHETDYEFGAGSDDDDQIGDGEPR